MAKEDFIKLTGIWKNRDGKPWMSGKAKVSEIRAALDKLGSAEKVNFFVFENNKRPGKNDPDANINVAAVKPKDARPVDAPAWSGKAKMTSDSDRYSRCPACKKIKVNLGIAFKRSELWEMSCSSCGHQLQVPDDDFDHMCNTARRGVLQDDLMMLGIIPSGPHKPKPKGKKKTFIRITYQEACDKSSYWCWDAYMAARDYWEVNPGSILEIVVRKPVAK